MARRAAWLAEGRDVLPKFMDSNWKCWVKCLYYLSVYLYPPPLPMFAKWAKLQICFIFVFRLVKGRLCCSLSGGGGMWVARRVPRREEKRARVRDLIWWCHWLEVASGGNLCWGGGGGRGRALFTLKHQRGLSSWIPDWRETRLPWAANAMENTYCKKKPFFYVR